MAEKLAAGLGVGQSVAPPPHPTQSQRPAAIERKLPPVRLYHRSDRNAEVEFVPAVGSAVAGIANALMTRNSDVILTWPDKLKRPLAAVVAALLRAQSFEPRLRATIAYYPFPASATLGLRSIFVDEKDIAARYRKLLLDMDRSEYDTADYKYAYIFKSLDAAGLGKISTVHRPSLRELIPIFRPRPGSASQPIEHADPEFLADIASKRILIKEASRYRKEIASIDGAAIAILGLPEEIDDINRCFKQCPRLFDQCDLVVADSTMVPFGETGAWLRRLRRLKHLASNHTCRPGIVVLAGDPFTASASLKVLNSHGNAARETDGQEVVAHVHTFIKTAPQDFSAEKLDQQQWNPVTVSVYAKERRMASLTRDAVSLASELRVAGYSEPGDAVIYALTYVRSIACLPLPFDAFRAHLDWMEQASAITGRATDPYRPLHVLAALKRASELCGNLGDKVLKFRDSVAQTTTDYSGGGEISELVRGMVQGATRRATRTMLVLRDRVVLHAFDSWICEQSDLDQEKVEQKVILTTSDALSSALSAARQGAPIGTLLLVNPKIKDFQRILMSAALPKRIALVGEPGGLDSFRRRLSLVIPLLSGEPQKRVAAMLDEISVTVEDLPDFDFEKIISAEYKAEMTLDFTASNTGEGAYSGPVIEIRTEDGYLLRLLPTSDCLVVQDDDLAPLKRKPANQVTDEDRIFVLTRDLNDRLDSILGPVQTSGSVLLRSYHDAVHERAAAIPGSKANKAREIARRIRRIATEHGVNAELGADEIGNVTRWISAGRVDGRPDAPRSQSTFALFMAALGFPETISAQYWHNAVVNTRVLAIQAGLQAHGRAQEFVLNPHAFYARNPKIRSELRQIWEEMVRSASAVVEVKLLPSAELQ